MKSELSFDALCGVLPEATADLLRVIGRVAEVEDQALYVVGGPIRDWLLERPLVDLDLMVDGDLLELTRAILAADASGALRCVEHSRFGTFRVENDEASIDLAQLRHESYAHPGALPDVTGGDLEQDIARRDFSVNALMCRLRASRAGRAQPIIDRVGGLEDLGRRRLRVLHARSFHDDPTRAWRAARFGARLGFTLERTSRGALRDALRDGAFASVSGERYRRELQLAFADAAQGTNPGRILKSLSDWHVLSALEPGLALRKDRALPLRRLGRAVQTPEWSSPKWRPWLAGLAIWLAPHPAALRKRTLERFSIRGEQASRIVVFGREGDRHLRGLARARGRGAVDALLSELSEETVQALYACADAAVRRRILRWGAEDRRRRPPVNGSDLTEAGLAGPAVGKALARIRAGFLDGEIANREEALALALEIARRSAARDGVKRSKRKKGAKRRKSVAPGKAIADTASRRRRPSSPENASPQADPSR